MSTVLIDAGPLVALIDRSDPYHDACREALDAIDDPLGTVWPAFTEAMYSLRSSARAQRALWDMALGNDDCPRMRELMWKYRDLPMDLADAALVRVPNASACGASSPWTVRTSRFIGCCIDSAASTSFSE